MLNLKTREKINNNKLSYEKFIKKYPKRNENNLKKNISKKIRSIKIWFYDKYLDIKDCIQVLWEVVKDIVCTIGDTTRTVFNSTTTIVKAVSFLI